MIYFQYMTETEFQLLTEEQFALLVEGFTEDDTLDPTEELIRNLFQASPLLRGIFGPYFDWNLEPQGLPYAQTIPVGGGPNIYSMPGGPNKHRSVISQHIRQLSVFATDRNQLKNPVTGILQEISRVFEAVHDLPMKQDHVCSSILMRMDWHTVYEQSKQSALNTNCWHAFARFEFVVQRRTGVQ